MPEDLKEIVAHQIRAMDPGEGRIVAAVSGGGDSVALLRGLACVLPPARLVVAHFNHGLRGAESDADAAFVARLAGTLGLFHVNQVWAETDRNLAEERSRAARYAFLEAVAHETDATAIATGHTADDQAETILHHMLRGTGLRGLKGIPADRPLRPGSPIRLIRPLLGVGRAELEGWLRSLGQAWRTDPSNLTGGQTRSRLRHELLPWLRREMQPRIDDLLTGLGEQAAEVFEYLQGEARALLGRATIDRQPGSVRLNGAMLERAAPVLLRELLVEIWAGQNWPRRGMTRAHWERAEEVAAGRSPAADMPDGLRIERRGTLVIIEATRGG